MNQHGVAETVEPLGPVSVTGLERLELSERLVVEALMQGGWKVLRPGWPDFLCVRRHHSRDIVMAVEVKANGDRPSPSQRDCFTVLGAIGLPVYVVKAEDIQRTGEAPKFRGRLMRTPLPIDLAARIADTEHLMLNPVRAQIAALEAKLAELKGLVQDAMLLPWSEAPDAPLLSPLPSNFPTANTDPNG